MANRPRTIGLLGGSFNPAHDGHFYVSLQAMRRLGLDEVWWLVSPQNPLKSTDGMAPFADRFASAERIAGKSPHIHVSDFEQRFHTRYTADTLRQLQRKFPRLRFVWIMGADNLAQIHRWHEWEEIFRRVHVAVYDRAPYTLKALAGHASQRFSYTRCQPEELLQKPLPAWTFMLGKRHPLSATAIRKSLGKKAVIGHNKNR